MSLTYLTAFKCLTVVAVISVVCHASLSLRKEAEAYRQRQAQKLKERQAHHGYNLATLAKLGYSNTLEAAKIPFHDEVIAYLTEKSGAIYAIHFNKTNVNYIRQVSRPALELE